MNVWRWLGLSVFMIAALCLISTAKLPVYGGQDKDKKTDKADDKSKKPDDKAKPDDKSKKPDDKAKPDDKTKKPDEKKPDEKKPDDKKPDVKPVVGGDKLAFSAFDPKSKEFYQVLNTKTSQTMTVMNQKVEQKQEQTFLIEWKPMPMAGGDWVVEQKIKGVKMEINIGGNKISFDSTGKNPKNPMTDFFDALMRQKLTFTIAPDLTVKKIDGRDDFIKNLSDINPQMKALLNAILSDSALKKMAEPTWYAFPPGGAITKDQTWAKVAELDLGPIGKYKTDFSFTNKGVEGGKDKIEVKTTLAYTAPSEKTGLPFVIEDAKLTSDNGKGEALFDRAKGRFSSSKLEMKLTGQLKINVGNMTTTVDLNQEQNASSVTLDDAPADWKSKQ